MQATDTTVLELIELTKVYRDFWGRESVKALDSLNLQVHPGEVFGLLGPNGSGKTTTVRLVLGLLFPSRGAVRLFGRAPQRVDIKRRVGYMPEESHLYPYLNAEETLDFFGRLFHIPRAERRRRVDALIDMVGLKRARTRPVGQFSKGMARRIGLAQSLINDPDFLILDEPTTGLDPIGSREMKDLILTLRERGKTILLCSHLLADVEEICDRLSILYGGKQRAQGPVGDLLTASEYTEIRAPRLAQHTLQKVLDVIRQDAGAEIPVTVGAPTQRLEDYFLNVVKAARRERLATAGAEVGTGTAGFLGGQQPSSEELLEELVQAAQAGAEAPKHGPEPVMSVPTLVDEGLLSELTRTAPAQGPGGAQPGREAPAAAAPETSVRDDVLRGLIVDAGGEKEADEDKDS
jgi:ABC-2 type transport system ATP-binding protein